MSRSACRERGRGKGKVREGRRGKEERGGGGGGGYERGVKESDNHVMHAYLDLSVQDF